MKEKIWKKDNDYIFKASIIRGNGIEEPIKVKAVRTNSGYPSVHKIIFDKTIIVDSGDSLKIYQEGVVVYK